MTQTELRIGNFVSAKTTSESFNVVSEIGDGGSGRGWYVRLENVNHGVWLEHNGKFLIEGIELTEEWLLNLGFEKSYFNNIPYFERGVLTIDGCFFDIELMDSSKLKINYVHQLQNLYFALVGSELQLLEAEA